MIRADGEPGATEYSQMKLTPKTAIRAHCLDCCNLDPREVRLCPAKECPLWRYRMGKDPETVERGRKRDTSHLKAFGFQQGRSGVAMVEMSNDARGSS